MMMGGRGPPPIKFYSYLNLLNTETPYGKRMTRLSRSIFGEPTRPSQYRGKNMNVTKKDNSLSYH